MPPPITAAEKASLSFPKEGESAVPPRICSARQIKADLGGGVIKLKRRKRRESSFLRADSKNTDAVAAAAVLFFAASGSGGKFTPIRNLGPRAVFPLSFNFLLLGQSGKERIEFGSLSLFSPQTALDCTFRTPPPFSSKSSSNVHFRGGKGERGRSKSFPMRSSPGVPRTRKIRVFLSAPSRKSPPHLIV